MNILMVHPHDLFDESEPWTIRIKNIAKGFVAKGHKVRLCYFPLGFNKNHYPKEYDLIQFIPLNRKPSPVSFIKNTVILKKNAKWADIVHFQKCHHYSSVPTVLAAYLENKPLHYDWDDWEEKIWLESCGHGLNSLFVSSSFKVLERCLPLLCETMSVASNGLKKLALKFGKKEDSIFFTPVGADLDKFNPQNCGERIKKQYNITGNLVVYVGQLHGAQYVDMLLQAANSILHKNDKVKFMVVGDGFMEKSLRKLAEDLNITDKVIFTGSVPHDEIPDYIAAAEVCVASFSDNKITKCKSPLKIAEYLASGAAIVASNVGEVRNMVGGAGVLVKPSSQEALAGGISLLLDNEKLRSELSIAARKRACESYNWEVSVVNLLNAYKKSLSLKF